MAKNKSKQSASKVSGKQVKNMKKQQQQQLAMFQAGPSRISEGSAPVARSYRVATAAPMISQNGRTMRVRHRELVVPQIMGSTSFLVNYALSLNPGLSGVFPWLSSMARNWDQYRFLRLVAEYIPIAPSNTQGDVLLSPDYDASNPVPNTEQEASNDENSVVDSCWRRIDMKFNPASLMAGCTRKYIRTSAIAGDIKTFDVGKLFVCTNNASAAVPFGKLYLEYDVEFFVPKQSPEDYSVPQQTSLFTRNTNQTFATGTPSAVNFQSNPYDPLEVGLPVAGVFTPPAGCYRLKACVTLADASPESFSCEIEIMKNGASLPFPCAANGTCPSFASGELVNLAVEGIIPCNGSDTFQVTATLNGAAGALVALAGSCQLMIELA